MKSLEHKYCSKCFSKAGEIKTLVWSGTMRNEKVRYKNIRTLSVGQSISVYTFASTHQSNPLKTKWKTHNRLVDKIKFVKNVTFAF